MATIEELQAKLEALRAKWQKWPRTPYEPNYWKFRADRAIAIRLKQEIELLKQSPDTPLDNAQLEAAVDLHFK
jgi:hypothetical protein